MARAARSACAAQQRAQVEIGEHVAVERQEAILEVIAELIGGEADGARGPQRRRLGHVADADARPLLLAQRLAQDVGQEAAGEHDLRRPRASASHSTM